MRNFRNEKKFVIFQKKTRMNRILKMTSLQCFKRNCSGFEQGVQKRCKILKPFPELKKDFENAKRLEREEKVATYWNFLYDKIHTYRCGYFRISHPTPDILDEIINIGKVQGYEIEFKEDSSRYPSVCYVVINKGF